jgi:hypothetical protein
MVDKTRADNAILTAQLAYDVVRLRIEGGDHPDDAMLSGLGILEAWVYVNIDGQWPSRDAVKAEVAAAFEAESAANDAVHADVEALIARANAAHNPAAAASIRGAAIDAIPSYLKDASDRLDKAAVAAYSRPRNPFSRKKTK